MAILMKVNGRIQKKMDKEFTSLQMVILLMVNLRMAKKMEKEFFRITGEKPIEPIIEME